MTLRVHNIMHVCDLSLRSHIATHVHTTENLDDLAQNVLVVLDTTLQNLADFE